MDSRSIDRIRHVVNTEVVRKLLIRYFVDKGFNESFDRMLYPAVMQDVPQVMPNLSKHVEVVPHAKDIDPTTGRAVLGWNLFVLGTHRMYLGETHHDDLSVLARQIQSGMVIPEGSGAARMQCTPRQVVNFVTRVLSRHESGYVNLRVSAKQQLAASTVNSGRMRY